MYRVWCCQRIQLNLLWLLVLYPTMILYFVYKLTFKNEQSSVLIATTIVLHNQQLQRHPLHFAKDIDSCNFKHGDHVLWMTRRGGGTVSNSLAEFFGQVHKTSVGFSTWKLTVGWYYVPSIHHACPVNIEKSVNVHSSCWWDSLRTTTFAVIVNRSQISRWRCLYVRRTVKSELATPSCIRLLCTA